MKDIQILIWLFPIIFIFHDLEEIIFMKPWINKYRSYLNKRFPRLSKKMLPHFDQITTSTFAMGVAEEFIFVSIVTITAYLNQWYYLWEGFFIAFTVHLIIHCIQMVVIRRYVPAIVTSIICLPCSIVIIMNTIELFQSDRLLLFIFISVILLAINLMFIHKLMDMFGKFLANYERNNK